VLDYYVVLDSILRDKPQVRRLLAWCRHCGIPFIGDPRNVGREDLGCPFGCADLHRRRCSTERSVAYNSSARGKLKRYQREEEWRRAEEHSATEGSQPPELHTIEESQEAISRSTEPLPRDRRGEHPCPSPAVFPPASDPMAIGSETAAPVTATHPGAVDPSQREPDPRAIGGTPPAGSEQLFPPGIVSYIRVVISLLEGRPVHREEILEMLARTRRQHSFAREKRIDYVLRRLREEPDKPP